MNIDSNSSSMNGPRSIENIKQSSLLAEQIRELKVYNDKLYEENLKYTKRISLLEENQSKIINQLKNEENNTSSNFFLISQIADIWTELAKENIINCFIDFISNPELLYDLFQEMVKIIQLALKKQIDSIINSFITQLNLSVKENNYAFISLSIRNIIREFYYDIFESKCSRNEDCFNQFKQRYLYYTQSKVKGMVNRTIQTQFIEDLDSIYFKKMYYNIQRILFFIEFKANKIHLELYDNDKRSIKPIEIKRNDCLCVEGLFNEQKKAIILLDAPKTSNGFNAFKQLKPIVISYSKRSNSQENIRHHKADIIIEDKLESCLSLNSILKETSSAITHKQQHQKNTNNNDTIKENTVPLQKRSQLFESLRLTQLNNNKLSYQRINYLLFNNKSKGRSHSKTPIKDIQNFYLSKDKYSKKLRNTMIISGKCLKNKKKINRSNVNEQRSNTCATEINDNLSNLNAKSVYMKYKETISMKLKERMKKLAYNINSPTSIHVKKINQKIKSNLKHKKRINDHLNHHYSNSYTQIDYTSDERLTKLETYNSKRSTMKQILSPLRTTPNIKIKTTKGLSSQLHH